MELQSKLWTIHHTSPITYQNIAVIYFLHFHLKLVASSNGSTPFRNHRNTIAVLRSPQLQAIRLLYRAEHDYYLDTTLSQNIVQEWRTSKLWNVERERERCFTSDCSSLINFIPICPSQQRKMISKPDPTACGWYECTCWLLLILNCFFAIQECTWKWKNSCKYSAWDCCRGSLCGVRCTSEYLALAVDSC